RHGDVGRRHPDGIAAELASQFRQRLGDSLGRTGLGDDHVQRRAAAPTVALVEVIDQVLVVSVRMNCFDVTVEDAVFVVDRLEHRHDGIGGAGRRGNDLVFRGDGGVVDTVHDILQVALARRGQHYLGGTRALEVLGQARLVTPYPGVVDDDGIVDPVGGVVDAGRIAGVDHLDLVAIGSQGVVFFINGDGALEGAVHRVPAQQAGPLGQVVRGALAHHDRAQAQTIAGAGLLYHDARQQAADAPEAVEHHITPLALPALATDQIGRAS